MKKTLVIITILSLLISFPMGVFAASGPKDMEVMLSDTPTAIKVGETIEFTAISGKQGSSYIDDWYNAEEISTAFSSETETYISKAKFTAEKPGIYNIRYTIQMTAGNSSTAFYKVVERTIEVIEVIEVVDSIEVVTVIGALISDLTVKPIYKADGSISAYSASASTCILWSDNTSTPYGSIYFNFGPDEISKDVRVTLNVKGIVYNYYVPVTRENTV